MKKSYFNGISALLGFCVLALIVIGCVTKRTAESNKTAFVATAVHDTLRDSIYINNKVYVRDSVLVYQQGDTIFKDRWKVVTEYQDRWRDRWRTEIKHDTIFKTDSVVVIKEKQITKLQRLRMYVGDLFAAIALLVAAVIVWRMIRKDS